MLRTRVPAQHALLRLAVALGLGLGALPASASKARWERVWAADHPPPSSWASSTASSRALEVSPNLWVERFEVDAAVAAPPRRLLLDRARRSMRLGQARELAGGAASGQGVVIGVVDSGIDLMHPDLRDASGGTRMAWWLDFGNGPYGFHADLERELGCDGETLRCGILGPNELSALVAGTELEPPLGGEVSTPKDSLGHGTLVASLALGNGSVDERYSGVAPEAVLIAARVATTSATVGDLEVMLAARFVFERARDLGLPAVLNLSLGGDLGPHDGSTTLERALGDWVSDSAGRVVVAAAGNSGSLGAELAPYPGPSGIHTDVHVPRGTRVRVPLVFPASDSEGATVYVWLASEPEDELALGLEEGDGTKILPLVGRGESASATDGTTDATVLHHTADMLEQTGLEGGALLVLRGAFAANSVFALLLEGEASVDLWVQSEGALAPEAGRGQALFPRATRERTVTIPATALDVIAVGATLNRTTWTSFDDEVVLSAFDPELRFGVGTVMPFSSAGPSARGAIKPDLVAPGGAIIGALADGAEAVRGGGVNWGSIFGPTPLCRSLGCAQVDEDYGISAGTSMAAPLVSGAAALLLQRDPTLTASALRALLQAGARRTPSSDVQSGAGLLDVENTFIALRAAQGVDGAGDCEPNADASWLSFGQSYARPLGVQPVQALLHLRAANGAPCDLPPGALQVQVARGRSLAPATRTAPGLYRMDLVADARGGDALAVSVSSNGRVVTQGELPIAVDSSVLNGGVSTRGGCAFSAPASHRDGAWLVFLLLTVRRARRKTVSPAPRVRWPA